MIITMMLLVIRMIMVMRLRSTTIAMVTGYNNDNEKDHDNLHAEVAQQADTLLVDSKPQFRTFN